MRLSIPRGRRPAVAAAAALALAAGALALSAPRALAQVADTVLTDSSAVTGSRTFEVSAIVGYQLFDRSAALRDAAAGGVRFVNARILPSVPGLSLGFTAGFARPTTRGEYFPWNRQIYYSDINRRNDTTLVFEVSQRVTMANYGAELGWRVGGGDADSPSTGLRGVAAEVSAGVGGYAFWLDPEQTRTNSIRSKLAYTLGAGIGVPLRGGTTLRVRADDLIFTGFDRNWFSLHDPLFAEELFQNPERQPPAPKNTVHNLRLSMQFSFFPGVSR